MSPSETSGYDRDQRDHRNDRREDQRSWEALIAAHAERITALERWQGSQANSLTKLETKLDRASDRVDEKLKGVDEKLDGLKMWMMSSLFTALLALLGIAFSMLKR